MIAWSTASNHFLWLIKHSVPGKLAGSMGVFSIASRILLSTRQSNVLTYAAVSEVLEQTQTET
jgi:hypothetical protein